MSCSPVSQQEIYCVKDWHNHEFVATLQLKLVSLAAIFGLLHKERQACQRTKGVFVVNQARTFRLRI